MGGDVTRSIISSVLGILSILYVMAPALMIHLGLGSGIVLGTMGLYFSKRPRDVHLPDPLAPWFRVFGKITSIFGISLNGLFILVVIWFSFFSFT
jgi:hypothetical protein